MLFTKNELDEAAELVHRFVPPTPQHVWPQICEKAGATVWVKHENHVRCYYSVRITTRKLAYNQDH